MPFSWSGAMAGGGDALTQLMARRYKETQEAQAIAREIAREAQQQQNWQALFNQNKLLAEQQGSRAERQMSLQENQAVDERNREEARQRDLQTTRNIAADQRNARRLLLTGKDTVKFTPGQAQGLQVQGLMEGIELPNLTDPDITRAREREDIEFKARTEARFRPAPGSNAQPLQKLLQDPTGDQKWFTGVEAINQALANGYRDASTQSERKPPGLLSGVYSDEMRRRTTAQIADVRRGMTDMNTGWAALWNRVPKSESMMKAGEIEALKSSITKNEINEMRAASATGTTALGQIAIRELQMLENSLGQLKQEAGKEQIEIILQRIEGHLKTWEDAKREAQRERENKGLVQIAPDADLTVLGNQGGGAPRQQTPPRQTPPRQAQPPRTITHTRDGQGRLVPVTPPDNSLGDNWGDNWSGGAGDWSPP